MPKGYERMRDEFAKTMSYDKAQTKAAKIWNSQHPNNPVTSDRDDKQKGKK